jgi:hypothetical protein
VLLPTASIGISTVSDALVVVAAAVVVLGLSAVEPP